MVYRKMKHSCRNVRGIIHNNGFYMAIIRNNPRDLYDCFYDTVDSGVKCLKDVILSIKRSEWQLEVSGTEDII